MGLFSFELDLLLLQARDLVNPRPKSMFVQRLSDKKEDIYASIQRAPLGKETENIRFLIELFINIFDTLRRKEFLRVKLKLRL